MTKSSKDSILYKQVNILENDNYFLDLKDINNYSIIKVLDKGNKDFALMTKGDNLWICVHGTGEIYKISENIRTAFECVNLTYRLIEVFEKMDYLIYLNKTLKQNQTQYRNNKDLITSFTDLQKSLEEMFGSVVYNNNTTISWSVGRGKEIYVKLTHVWIILNSVLNFDMDDELFSNLIESIFKYCLEINEYIVYNQKETLPAILGYRLNSTIDID